jgi:glycerol dehydrogenase-like iron-containing ADH family enzyme
VAVLDLIFDWKSGDAFVYASVERHLKQSGQDTRLFITRDADFESTRDWLSKSGIELVIGIGAGYGAVRRKLDNK